MTTNKEKPELLAPLKNWKSIAPQTKVLENADAFYFGLNTNFSMRARADNFAPDEVKKLVEKVHDAGKKLYLTTNILIYNKELIELYQTIEHAFVNGVDAVICHDPASIMIARDIGMPFHVSTMANISNKISAKFYESLGAERIILARELDIKSIKEIVNSVSIPVETFVHGAMCMAVSGRCFLSSQLMGFDTEFSANRGKCVQPCRRVFRFLGEEGEEIVYEPTEGMFFNAKDLSMIEHVPLLVETGIGSFKIEGRMRDPLYISEVVSCYREAIDAYFAGEFTADRVKNWKERLNKVFNRGYHTGFYFVRPGPNDVQKDIRGNVSPWHRVLVGKVINYYKRAGAVEVELTHGRLAVGQTIIFENKSDHFSKQQITSLQIDNEQVDETPLADSSNHIVVGIKTEQKVPVNSLVYIFKLREDDSEGKN